LTNSNTATEANSVSVIGALKQGFSAALGYLWIGLVFWGASLLLALLAALPLRSLLLGEAGNSLMVKDLVKSGVRQ
jgi:predicted phage tail protein